MQRMTYVSELVLDMEMAKVDNSESLEMDVDAFLQITN